MLELRGGRGRLPDRLRQKTIAALDAGPRAIVPLLAAVATLVGAAGLLLLVLGSASGSQPVANRLALWGLAALAAIGVLGLAADRLLPRAGAGEPTAGRDLLTAVLLAAAALLPLLLLPIHYMAARTHPSALHWNAYGFRDKRWITTSFLILVAGAPVLLAVAARVVAIAHRRPEAVGEDAPAEERSGSRAALGVAVKLACAIAVGAYFVGPPWPLAAAPLGYHETNTLGGVQAIHTGSLPYIDAAAVQYGPGAQVADYLYAKATGHFSVAGFREATLVFNLLAATLFLAALYLRVGPLAAAVTTLVAVAVFPTLQIFHVDGRGFMHGFWGWGNTLRYGAVFALAMLFPAVVSRPKARWTLVPAVALGVLWALLCLVAQENLIGGVLVLGVLSVLHVATDTAPLRQVLSSLAGLAAGFLLTVLPVLAFYAAHGRLGRFLELYWLVPQAVASGYSNTVLTSHEWAPLFYGLPFLLGALLLASLFTGRPLRIATRWSKQRVVLASALVAAVVCHLGALTRSDKSHLINTELALPAALCLAAFYLPGLLGATSRRWRWAGGLAIAASALALLPLSPYASQPKRVALRLWRPLHARVHEPARSHLTAPIPAHSIAAARMGTDLLRARQCCTKDPVPTAELVRFMNRLHATVGSRRVYVVHVSHKTVVPPAVYFLADLRPVATPQERGTMVFNRPMRADWLRAVSAHVGRIEAIVTLNLRSGIAKRWVAAFPNHRTVTLPLGRYRVHVLIRPPVAPG